MVFKLQCRNLRHKFESFDSMIRSACSIRSDSPAAIDVANSLSLRNVSQLRCPCRILFSMWSVCTLIPSCTAQQQARRRSGIARLFDRRPEPINLRSPRWDDGQAISRRTVVTENKVMRAAVESCRGLFSACQSAHNRREDWQRATSKVVVCRPRHPLGRDSRCSRVAPLPLLQVSAEIPASATLSFAEACMVAAIVGV